MNKNKRKPMRLIPSLLVVTTGMLFVYGCDDTDRDNSLADVSPTAQTPIEIGPQWQAFGESLVLPAEAPQDNEQLAAAIELARESLADARTRWSQESEVERQRWAVKWAAPLSTGDVEYLWVHPAHWSPFRVEGILLNDPVHALLDGGARGDAVSFPDEEICDWIRLPSADANTPPEGGFTNEVLTQIKDTGDEQP